MMTNRQIIEVVQAAEEGKTIQVRSGTFPSEWENCSNRCDCPWNFGLFDYRVAPEPQRFMKGYCFPCHIQERATIGMIKIEQVPFGEGENPIQPRKPREWTLAIDTQTGYVFRARENIRDNPSNFENEFVKVREVIE